jgi:hypothetical protein
MKTTKVRGKLLLVAMSAMMLAFVLVAAGCNQDDDDDDDNNSSNSGGGKPAQLAADATYQQALDKCDEIIAYCDSHAGTTNNTIKSAVQIVKTSITTAGASNWVSTYQASMITALNTYIIALE